MKVCVLGGSFDSGNLGLEALTCALINGIWLAEPGAEITVFDFVRKTDEVTVETPAGPRPVRRCGLNDSRRYWSTTSLGRMRALRGVRLLDGPSRRALRDADVVIDISGGDSFTDLYGMRRLRAMCAVKELVLDLGVPLVLGPQTYGPFRNAESQDRARAILQRAAQVWARDVDSRARAEKLVGDGHGFECRQGVDLAFALPAEWRSEHRWNRRSIRRDGRWSQCQRASLEWGRGTRPFLGLEVDYRDLVVTLAERILSDGVTSLLLVPHVLATPGTRSLISRPQTVCFKRCIRSRGNELPSPAPVHREPGQGFDWPLRLVRGVEDARHHRRSLHGGPNGWARVLPQVPGVFESAGVAAASIDLREHPTETVVQRSLDLWDDRETQRVILEASRRDLKVRAAAQVAIMLEV